VYGPIKLTLGPQFTYQVNLFAAGIDLARFAQQGLDRKGQVRGRANAGIALAGRGTEVQSMRGGGWVQVPNGAHLYDLPLVFDLLTFLSGRVPKGSAFQEANARFTIDGGTVKFGQLEFLGDALSLRGQGDLRLDATAINLEMYGLLWGRTLPLLPPLIDQIPPEISKQLMTIRLKGDLGHLKIETEPVPLITEPLKALWARLREVNPMPGSVVRPAAWPAAMGSGRMAP
jgi:hypothetical protein